MAAKSKPTIDAKAAAKAVEDALDIELTFDDLVDPDLSSMNNEEVFNELERKLSAAAADLKDTGNENELESSGVVTAQVSRRIAQRSQRKYQQAGRPGTRHRAYGCTSSPHRAV